MPSQCEVSEGFFEGGVVEVVKLAEGGDFYGTELEEHAGSWWSVPGIACAPRQYRRVRWPGQKSMLYRCLWPSSREHRGLYGKRVGKGASALRLTQNGAKWVNSPARAEIL
jgi:hypothetical protein